MTNDKLRNIIWKHVRSIHTCMMITMDGDQMRARPMVGIARPEMDDLDIPNHVRGPGIAEDIQRCGPVKECIAGERAGRLRLRPRTTI